MITTTTWSRRGTAALAAGDLAAKRRRAAQRHFHEGAITAHSFPGRVLRVLSRGQEKHRPSGRRERGWRRDCACGDGPKKALALLNDWSEVPGCT
jgi:hypothetical protein